MSSLATPPRVVIPLSTTGHDPTEVSIPYSIFTGSGLLVDFATESGKPFACDSRMLTGITGTLLGADAAAKKAYAKMLAEADEQRPGSAKRPLCWRDAEFSMEGYDVVFLPGGHEKGVRTLIEAEEIHRELRKFFPLTKREPGASTAGSTTSSSTKEEKQIKGQQYPKVLAAICHGVQVLSSTPAVAPSSSTTTPDKNDTPKSIIHACSTTALPSFMETSIYTVTYPFLGDYYKTYGSCSPNVEHYVRRTLDDPDTQFQPGPAWWTGKAGRPFVVVDKTHRYVSARFPPDAEEMSKSVLQELGWKTS